MAGEELGDLLLTEPTFFILVSATNSNFKSLLSPSILLCFLSEPNDESGANVDASKMWREDRDQFYRLAQKIVRKSLGL